MQCDVVSFGSSTGEAAASRLDQDKSSRSKGLSAALLNLRETACNDSIASRQPRQLAPAPSKKECSA